MLGGRNMDNDCPRLILTILLTCLLCVPVAAAAAPPAGEGAANARGEYRQAEPCELEFNNTTYSNSTFSFALPSNSTIYSASVDLEGMPVVGPLRNELMDYSGDNTNFVAYGGTITRNTPGTGKPASFSATQLQSSDLGRIAYLDGTCAEQWAYAYYGSGDFGYHHFKFKVPLDIVCNITATWAGYSGYYYYNYGGYGTAIAYLWNNVTLAWETIGSATGGLKSVSKQFTNASNYVDGNNCVHVLALTSKGWNYYGYYDYNSIDTDYVSVNVTGNVLTYPKNPSLDIGANGRIEWSVEEEKFNYQVTVADSTLANELQKLVNNAPGRYTEIKVRVKSASIGRINITNFTVAYNSPPWCKGIPDSFHIAEDAPSAKLINLSRYFEDDQDRLIYEITYKEDPKKLDAMLNTDGRSLDFKLPTRNWWGTAQFRVKATDPEDPPLWRESNIFTVTVEPVNDPPVIAPLSKQVAMQDKPFKMTVTAKDVDIELYPEETITFSDNSSLFDINPATGVISFTPKQNQVGTYLVGITATDRAGAADRKNFTLEVLDAEDPPLLDPIPELTATQDQVFRHRVTAKDPDLPYGDWINFTDDSPLFQVHGTTGLIEFTPTVNEVGVHKVAVTVVDKAGMRDTRSFNLVVLNSIGNIDRPPVIQAVVNQSAQEDVPFRLEVKGSDPDIAGGDVLTFSDDSALFDIDPATGVINFTPARKDAGTTRVRLTVTDRDGLSASTEFWLTVNKTDHPPNIISLLPDDGTGTEIDRRVLLCATATDPDGDELNYTWKIAGEAVGYGPSTTITFGEKGTFIITLIVSDGLIEVSSETSVVVQEPQQTTVGGGGKAKNLVPGFETGLVACVLSAALMILALRRKR